MTKTCGRGGGGGAVNDENLWKGWGWGGCK